MNQNKFDIKGMTCTACALAIERQLSKIDGVESVVVNYATEQMQISYDNDAIANKDITSAVEQVGYEAYAVDQSKSNSADQTNRSNNKSQAHAQAMMQRLLYSLVFTLPLFYLAMGPMVGLPLPSILKGQQNLLFMALTQLLLTLPVMIIGAQFYQVGFKTLLKGAPNMDSLIAVGTGAAFVYGIFVIYRLSYGFAYDDMAVIHKYGHDLYFESVAVIITLITLGKTLEAKAKSKTSAAISELMALTPDLAIVVRKGSEIVIPLEEVLLNDHIVVKPGAKIPADGIIIKGFSTIDESMLTGESLPIDKTLEDQVIAGTINQTGSFTFKVTAIGKDTTLAKIIQMVEDAQGTKAPIAKLADQISAYFVPAVIAISLVSMGTWLALGYDFEFAFRIAVSILVISCPCALGLATPTAIMVGTGRGAKHGTLIKSGEALELMHQTDIVVFDKTGTLTNGQVIVTDLVAFDDQTTMLSLAASVEQQSEHPLSQAVTRYASELAIELSDVDDFKALLGLGVQGRVKGHLVLVGNEKLMGQNKVDLTDLQEQIQHFASQGKTPIIVAYKEAVQGILVLADTIKDDATKAVASLQSMNIEVVMLTGDHKLTAQAIGKEVGADRIYAEVLPDEKASIIQTLQAEEKKVMMVGDGINDAVALVTSDVGLAIGSGTDVAIESADVVLIKNQIMDVVTAIQLSRATIRNIKQNLFWAFIYNIIGIPIAAGLLYKSFGVLLNPMIAAAAMSFSSVSVVSNALRLRGFKPTFITLDPETASQLEASEFAQSQVIVSQVTETQVAESTKMTTESKEKTIMKKTLTVEGMTCGHCTGRVEKTLSEMEGVSSVTVDLDTKLAVVEMNKAISDDTFKSIIADQGYEVVNID